METVLDGYRLGSDQGSIAFCSVTLVEGLDEGGSLKRILVDTGHTGRRPVLDAALRQRGLSRDSIDVVAAPTRTGITSRTWTSSRGPRW